MRVVSGIVTSRVSTEPEYPVGEKFMVSQPAADTQPQEWIYVKAGATFAAAFDKYKEGCGMKPGLVYMWTNNNNLPEKVWVGPYSTRWEGCDPEAYDSRPILIQDNRPAKLRRKHQHAIGEPMGQ